MRLIAELLGKSITEQVLYPEKITHIFDEGGPEIIASAQYGAVNRLSVFTGKNAHSLLPTIKTLYFYDYLLELPSNKELFLKETLQDTLTSLNAYHQNLNIYFSAFVQKVGGHKNKQVETRLRNFGKPPLSQELSNLYASIAQKVEQSPIGILLGLYLYSLEKLEVFDEEKDKINSLLKSKEIIDILFFLKENSYFIRSFDNARLKEYQIHLQKAQDEVAIKAALSTFACFVFVNQEDQCILTQENFLNVFGYKIPEINIALEKWDEEYLAFQAKTTRALYFGGSVQVIA